VFFVLFSEVHRAPLYRVKVMGPAANQSEIRLPLGSRRLSWQWQPTCCIGVRAFGRQSTLRALFSGALYLTCGHPLVFGALVLASAEQGRSRVLCSYTPPSFSSSMPGLELHAGVDGGYGPPRDLPAALEPLAEPARRTSKELETVRVIRCV